MKVAIWAFFFLSTTVALSAVKTREAVKFCGRDFIRAIVYTCGSSRWKRDLQGALEDGEEGKKHFEAPIQNGASDDITDLLYSSSPADDMLTQEQQPGGARQRKRQTEVADLVTFCCQVGCTITELSKLC
ncbi:insulin-like peptide INSL5 [Phascolarctos cinereus]|uniref:Insulin-like peptide INSL5 n=1 Tax=Phascolarctos cinereus TaxID=38626 RepID=A0A6P5KSB5_PHACI|nr:insulin-like peptide INSL5 [Phascolarctos cinereus]